MYYQTHCGLKKLTRVLFKHRVRLQTLYHTSHGKLTWEQPYFSFLRWSPHNICYIIIDFVVVETDSVSQHVGNSMHSETIGAQV